MVLTGVNHKNETQGGRGGKQTNSATKCLFQGGKTIVLNFSFRGQKLRFRVRESFGCVKPLF